MSIIKKVISTLLLTTAPTIFAYHTQNSTIYSSSGEIVEISGVSWSGFQDTNILQGLQSNPFYTYQEKPGVLNWLGGSIFKTIRLPIQPGVLYDDDNEVDINKALTMQTNPAVGNGLFCKSWQSDGRCALAVSSKKAFWTVIEEMKKQGLRVLVDMHHSYGYGDDKRDGTVYDIAKYAQDIGSLSKVIADKNLTNVIGIDIFNEPYRLNWFKSNQGQVAWTKVIATAANAIYENNPDLLVFVEGPNGGNDDQDEPVICVPSNEIIDDQSAYSHFPDPSLCESKDRVFFKGNWGEDFKPLLKPTAARNNQPELDINRFKQELLNQGISEQALNWLLGDNNANNAHIVFSPHVYPAEVAGWESSPGKPSQLRFDWSWGFLSKAGYSVALGEASWKTDSGKQFFTQSLMPYLAANVSTKNVFFWAIGYLGDTISAINPNTGEWNRDAYETLSSYFY